MMSKKRIQITPPRLSKKILSLIFADHGALLTIKDLQEASNDKLKEFWPWRARPLLIKIPLLGDHHALKNY
jgi:hypothetical protein